MPFSDALREKNGSVFIDIEVTPGSKVIQVPSGYNEWRKRIEVKISEAAQKGKANEQVIEEMAAFFNVSASRVSIENGMTSSKKTVRIENILLEDVFEKLKTVLS
jgi:TIGR00251 family protein